MTSPKVLTLVGTRDGSSMWRAWQPAAELQRRGHFVHWAWNDPESQGVHDQPPLGIGVRDLARATAVVAHHVTGAHGVAADRIMIATPGTGRRIALVTMSFTGDPVRKKP